MEAWIKIEADGYLRLLRDERCPLNLELSGMPIDFRPAPDWRVNLSGLSVHLFYFCLRGSIEVTVGGATESLSTGDAIWISPGQAFQMISTAPCQTRLSRFRLGLSDGKSRKLALKRKYLRSTPGSTYSGWLELVRQESILSSGAVHPELRCAVGGLLGSAFARKQGGYSSQADGRQLSVLQIRDLQDWLHTLEPHARPDTKTLATRVQLSRDYFNRLCHQTFGLSAERWLIQQRIEAAALRLIESNRTVSEVADEYGYSSLYFFSRQFRQIMGMSPSAYRNRPMGSGI